MILAVLLFVVCFYAWFALGCVVLAALDDDSLRLLEWAKRFPFGGLGMFIIMWPISASVVYWLRRKAAK